jgi:hypothetical protein
MEENEAVRALGVFVGRWNMQGRALESPFGPAAPITAAETYEWLPGGLFLIHRFYGRLGGQEMACVEVTGAAPDGDGYAAHTFYNDGSRNEWRLRVSGGTWTLSGSWPHADRPRPVRCTIAFNETRDAATLRWEYVEEGADWKTFWETSLTRA